MDSVAEAHHFSEEVGPVAEALEDTRHLLAPGFCTPLVVDLRNLACGVCVFDEVDFVLLIAHLSLAIIRFRFVSATQLSIFIVPVAGAVAATSARACYSTRR